MDDALITTKVCGQSREGEGYSTVDDKKVYIPYALENEIIKGQPYFRRGKQQAIRVEEVLEPSSKRGTPFCPKFTLCGGCQLQHLKSSSYKQFKEDLLNQALKDYDINYKASFAYWSTQSQRRRVSLSYEKRSDRLSLGFYRHRSHFIENIDSCPLLVKPLNDLIEPLRNFLTVFCSNRESGFIHLTLTDSGIDLSWSPARFKSRDLTIEKSQQWCDFAIKNNIARVTRAAKDLIIEQHKPALHWGHEPVPFPSASFLQPSDSSEKFMINTVLKWLEDLPFKPKKFYDLFCGLGTFSFPLLSLKGQCALESYDCDGPAMDIVTQVSKKYSNWHVEKKDLFQDPIEDFADRSIVIVDPPRQGAKNQVESLCQTDKKIVLVIISCDPASLARDLNQLVSSGFKLKEVIGIDQFPYTSHVESMAYLENFS